MAEGDRITVSEERLQRILADFKLELYKMLRDDLAKKADATHVDSLSMRVSNLEQHGSPEAQAALKTIERQAEKIESLGRWQNGLTAISAFLLLVLLPIAIVVIQHFLP